MTTLNRKKLQTAAWKTVLYILMTGLAFFMILPFYWSLLTSFRENSEIFSTKLYLTGIDTSHYEFFFDNIDFAAVLGNTIFVIVMIIFFSLLLCSACGYALAQFDFKGKKPLVKFFYASMMIPGIICLIPQFLVVSWLGMDSKLWGIIVPAVCSIYGCLFMRSFFMSSPKEIAEAARIDGANEIRIFLLYLPTVIPGLITLGLFTFNAHWNSYLWPYIMVGNVPELHVLSVAIKEFEIITSDDYGALMSASIVTVMPMIAIFALGQKYFMNNMTFTGIK